MDSAQFKEICRTQDHESLIELVSMMHTDAERIGNYPLASEMMLLKATLWAQSGKRDEAVMLFSEFIDTMETRIPELFYFRGFILLNRFLLRTGEEERVRENIEKFQEIESCRTDPLLYHDMALLELELRIHEYREKKEQGNVLLLSLEHYIKAKYFIERIYGKNYTNFKIAGETGAIELLLDTCMAEADHERFFYWLEYEKIQALCDLPLFSKLPLKGLGAGRLNRYIELEKKLDMLIKEYREIVSSYYHAPSAGAISSSARFDAARWIEKGKSLFSLNEQYLEEVESLCLITPMNDISRGVLPLSLSRVMSLLDQKSSVLTYLETPTRIYGGVLTSSTSKPFSLNIDREMQEKLTSQILGLSGIEGDETAQSTRVLQNIYLTLFDTPLRDLETSTTLYICPDTHLYMIPFQRLRNGKTTLGEKFHLSLFPSLRAVTYFLWNNRESFIPLTGILPGKGDATPLTMREKDPEILEHSFVAECYHLNSLDLVNSPSFFDETLTLPDATAVTIAECYSTSRPLYCASFTTHLDLFRDRETSLKNFKALLYFLFTLGMRQGKPRIACGLEQDKERESLRYIYENLHYGDFTPQTRRELQFYKKEPVKNGIFLIKDDIQAQPVVHQDIVLVGGRDFRLYAFNSFTGEMIWTYKSGDWLVDLPACEDDIIYLGGMDRRMRAISLTSGKILWEFRTMGWILGPPVIVKNNLLFASKGNSVYMLDKITGNLRLSIKCEEKIVSPPFAWNSAFLISTSDGKLSAYSMGDMKKVWEKQFPEPLGSAGTMVLDRFVFSMGRPRIHALKRESGREDWERKLSGIPLSIDILGDDKLLVLQKGNTVTLVDGKSGQVLWNYDQVIDSLARPCVRGKEILVQTKDRDIVSLDATTGAPSVLMPPLPLEGKFILPANNFLFTVDREGRLIRTALEEEKQISYCAYLQSKKTEKRGAFESPVEHSMLDCIAVERSGEEKTMKTAPPRKRESEISTMEIDFVTPPFVHNKILVCATSSQKIIGIHAATFQRLWEVQLSYPVFQAPVPYGNYIIATDTKGLFYIIDITSGSIAKKFNVCMSFNSPPLVDGDRIYIGGDNGVIYCISIAGEDSEWKRFLEKAVRATPLLSNGHLYIITRDGRLLKLEREKGKIEWDIDIKESLRIDMLADGKAMENNDSFKFDMVTGDDYIIIAGNGSTLYAVDKQSGKLAWHFVNSSGSYTGAPLLYDDTVYLGVKKGEIIAINCKDGTLLWRRVIGEPMVANPICCNRNLLAGTLSSAIYSINFDRPSPQILFTLAEPVWFPLIMNSHDLLVIEGTTRIRRFPLSSIPCSTPLCSSENLDEEGEAPVNPKSIFSRKKEVTDGEKNAPVQQDLEIEAGKAGNVTSPQSHKKSLDSEGFETILHKLFTSKAFIYTMAIIGILGLFYSLQMKIPLGILTSGTFLAIAAVMFFYTIFLDYEKSKKMGHGQKNIDM